MLTCLFFISCSLFHYKFCVWLHVVYLITYSVSNVFFCLITYFLFEYMLHVWLTFLCLITVYVCKSMMSIWLYNLSQIKCSLYDYIFIHLIICFDLFNVWLQVYMITWYVFISCSVFDLILYVWLHILSNCMLFFW